jgi:hypothetical protein
MILAPDELVAITRRDRPSAQAAPGVDKHCPFMYHLHVLSCIVLYLSLYLSRFFEEHEAQGQSPIAAAFPARRHGAPSGSS